MSSPVRIQLQRAKGWKMPAGAVKVGRRTKFGNPFDLRRSEHCWTAIAHGFKGDRLGRQAASVAMFAAWVLNGKPAESEGCGLYAEVDGANMPVATSPSIAAGDPPSLDTIRTELRGKSLGCWCKPGEPCHADWLLEVANR